MYGSSLKTTSNLTTRPSRERPRGASPLATPGWLAQPARAAATSAGRTGPFSRSTSTFVGREEPAGNERSITLKPSTLSVRFLKKLVVL